MTVRFVVIPEVLPMVGPEPTQLPAAVSCLCTLLKATSKLHHRPGLQGCPSAFCAGALPCGTAGRAWVLPRHRKIWIHPTRPPGQPCCRALARRLHYCTERSQMDESCPAHVTLLHEPPIFALQSEDEVAQINKHILALLYRTLRFKMQHDDSLRVSHTGAFYRRCRVTFTTRYVSGNPANRVRASLRRLSSAARACCWRIPYRRLLSLWWRAHWATCTGP